MSFHENNDECCFCEGVSGIVQERLKILTAGGDGFAQIEQFVKNNARDYEAYTNGNVNIEVTAAPNLEALFDEIKADTALSNSQFDGYVTNPQITGSAVQNGGFWDLEKFVKENDVIDWTDILLAYRNTVNVYNKKIYLMPLDGDTHSLFYRKDVLQRFGLQVPRTWQEYTSVAKAIHGKEYNGTELVGSCVGRLKGCVGYFWANLVLSSLTQYEGTTTGFLFDSQDMTPLTGDALAETIRYLEEQVKYGAPDEFDRCGGGGATSANIKYMNEGTCVMTYNWGDSFKIHLSEGSKIGGLLGVAKTPGSTHVFDRKTRKLVPCTAELCKFADYYPDLGWVNHAPYAAFGGWSAAVAGNNGQNKKILAAEFFAFASSREGSIKAVIPYATGPMESINGQDPFRSSHFEIEEWVKMGYPKEGVEEYRDTVMSNLNSENVAVDIRFPEADMINQVYDNEIHDYLYKTSHNWMAESEKEVERLDVVSRITNEWRDIIESYDSRPENDAKILDLYQMSLSIYVPQHNPNVIGGGMRAVGYTLMAVVFFCSVLFCFWSFWNRNLRIVKASQPFFLGMICFGTFLVACTIIPLGVDDSVASEEACDIACMFVPWLFALGFSVIFSALFSKIWRINKIIQNARAFKRLKVTTKDVLIPFVALCASNVVFLLIWTLVDPLLWERIPIDDSNSYGTCVSSGKTSTAMLVIIAAINLSALILANVQAYRARNVSDEYSESKYIFISMALLLQMAIIGIPLLFLIQTSPPAEYFVCSIIIFVICLLVLLPIFIPKFLLVKNYKEDKKEKRAEKAVRAFKPTVASSITGTSDMDIQTEHEGIQIMTNTPEDTSDENDKLLKELQQCKEQYKALLNLLRDDCVDVDTVLKEIEEEKEVI